MTNFNISLLLIGSGSLVTASESAENVIDLCDDDDLHLVEGAPQDGGGHSTETVNPSGPPSKKSKSEGGSADVYNDTNAHSLKRKSSKRSDWTPEVKAVGSGEFAVLELDPEGNFVKCLLCKINETTFENGRLLKRKVNVKIKTSPAFSTSHITRHLEGADHLSEVERVKKSSSKITAFFSKSSSTAKATAKSTVPVLSMPVLISILSH